jgi:hypothetical protein
MTRKEMIAQVAQDAYENATERELRAIFIEHMTTLMDAMRDEEIERIHLETLGEEM